MTDEPDKPVEKGRYGRSPRSAYRRGEDAGDVIGGCIDLLIVEPVRAVWRWLQKREDD